jgi:hypothetical protein
VNKATASFIGGFLGEMLGQNQEGTPQNPAVAFERAKRQAMSDVKRPTLTEEEPVVETTGEEIDNANAT